MKQLSKIDQDNPHGLCQDNRAHGLEASLVLENTTIDARIGRVCEFIGQNLDAQLTLESLSRVAALSKYHFHRVFLSQTGLNLAKFIQLARLRRASFRLAFEPGIKVIEIALEAGFESPEAFSRAFKRTFGQTPSHFRTAPQWPQWHTKYQFNLPPKGHKTMQVNIIDFPETKVALLEHRGSHDRVFETVAKFISWRKETGLSPIKTSKTFGIPHGDPKTDKPEDYRFDVCGTIESEVPENGYGVKNSVLPGGRCAVIQHRGARDFMEESILFMYREWLPQSGEVLRDYPCYFHYRNFIHQVDEYALLTDIYLPLQ